MPTPTPPEIAGPEPEVYYAPGQEAAQDLTPEDQLDDIALLQRLRDPIGDQPLRRLYIYPNTQGDPEQFEINPTFAEGQFPERPSRSSVLLDEVAGSWVLENEYAVSAVLAPFIRQSDTVDWQPRLFAWASPNFFSNPLYFEEVNLERYGIYSPFQSVRSAAHFFVTIPLLPYKMGANHPCECVYTLGYYRPGSCNPAFRNCMPISARGLTWQAIATTAFIAVIP